MPGGLSPQILSELLAFFSILALKAQHVYRKAYFWIWGEHFNACLSIFSLINVGVLGINICHSKFIVRGFKNSAEYNPNIAQQAPRFIYLAQNVTQVFLLFYKFMDYFKLSKRCLHLYSLIDSGDCKESCKGLNVSDKRFAQWFCTRSR